MRITQERRIFAIGFFFSFCIALAAYVNAAYLKNYVTTEEVGVIYTVTALFTIIVLYFFEYLGGKFGVQKTLIASLIISGVSGLILAQTSIIMLIIPMFVLMQMGLVITKFSADILIETHKTTTQGEGSLRGSYLAVTNLSWIIAAFLGGYFASINPKIIYSINGTVYTILSILVIFFISQTKKDIVEKTSFWEKAILAIKEKQTRKIILSEFILQTFYTIMVIFSPLYLREVLGFSFKEIGIMFSIMLIPFAVLQYPLGSLADRKYGEKEMIGISYLIMSLSVLSFILIPKHSFLSATLVLFISRIGACTLEVMNDAYFFTVTKEYKKILPIFKGMAPLALLLFGALGSTVITLSSYSTLFISLSIFILVAGIFVVYKMKDTR